MGEEGLTKPQERLRERQITMAKYTNADGKKKAEREMRDLLLSVSSNMDAIIKNSNQLFFSIICPHHQNLNQLGHFRQQSVTNLLPECGIHCRRSDTSTLIAEK